MDSRLSLALAVHSSRNAYAMLLGSGVSRSSGIPTGWEIVLDLIGRLAAASGKEAGPDLAGWYTSEYQKEPRYDELLDGLLPSPQDRRSLLRSFFEPTTEEREQGVKMPSRGHRAIAQLVAAGFVRIIVTTNFDRLIEQSLEEVSVRPIVIDRADGILGAPPISSGEVFVIKIHGDYMDSRIRNTPEELSEYEPPMQELLQGVFSDFGLVVCGWSGEWDSALRSLLSNRPPGSRPVYWASRSEPGGITGACIKALEASVILTRDADTFLGELEERVMSLEGMTRGAPISTAVAIATVKRYLPDLGQRIRLRDLLLDEADDLRRHSGRDLFPVAPALPPDGILDRIRQYENLTSRLAAMVSVGCFYGQGTYDALFVEILETVARERGDANGNVVLLALEGYPALLTLHAAGVSCVAGEEYGTLSALLSRARVRERGEYRPAVSVLHAAGFGEMSSWDFLPGLERHRTPLNDLLVDSIRPMVRETIPDDERYQDAFDRYEYLVALVHFDLRRSAEGEGRGWAWAPIGRFGWKGRRYAGRTVMDKVEQELTELGSEWGPLRAGMFHGSLDHAIEIKHAFDEWLVKATPGWDW